MFWRLESLRIRRRQRLGVAMAGWLALAASAATAPAASFAEANSQIGQPVVGKNADGHLEVFRVDDEGEVRRRWQKESNGDWSAWSSLGGGFLPGIALLTNVEGQLELWAVDRANLEVWHCHQTAPNSTEWSPWADLGGAVRPPLAVGQNADGRIEVVAVDATSGAVRHLYQTNALGGWTWGGSGGQLLPGLAVVRNRDGRLEIFGLHEGTRELVHCWQRRAGASDDWSEWVRLGGSFQPGFVAGLNVSGVLEVFAVNQTNGLERICQRAAGDSEHWTPWLDFIDNPPGWSRPQPAPSGALARGTPPSPLPPDQVIGRGSADAVHPMVATVEAGLALGQSSDHRLELFAVDRRDSTLLHRWEMLTDGSDKWSRWASLGANTQPAPAVLENDDGNLEVFAEDANDHATILHREQISQASDWLDWSSLDHSTFDYGARTWQVDEGLPDNVVQALAQTRDGHLWVGTRAGLARFDGLAFTPVADRYLPKHSSITALCASSDGALWVGTDGGGLTRLQGGVSTHYSQANGLAGDTVLVISESKDGALWVGTTTGMSRFKDHRFTTYTTKQGLLSDGVRAIYQDRDRSLWIATGEGLNRLRGDIMDSFLMPNGLPNDSVRCICQDQGGRIWIGSNNGMLWYNWYWMTTFYAYNTKYGLSDTFVSAICEDREGNLWVGTYSGLNRFREGRFFIERNNEGVPFDRVNAILEDREGNLWVGSKEGLVRLTPKRFSNYTRRQGLSHNNVMSVLEDRSGSLWVGTWGGGLNRLKDGKATAVPTSTSTTNESGHGLSQALTLALATGRDGSLWVGADFDGGLTHLHDGQLTTYTSKDGLIKAAVKVVHEDREGTVWIGTRQGLCCLREGRFTSFTGQNAPPGQAVRAICEDHAGDLWFGTDGGLSRWQHGRFTNFTTADGLSDNNVFALYEDAERNLWIGTGAGGLDRLVLPDRSASKVQSGTQPALPSAPGPPRIRAYTSRQGLFSDEIFEILEDDQGWLWMSCSQGVFRVRKADLNALDAGDTPAAASIAYGRNDGMESAQCNGTAKPAAWKTRDGHLWFATSKGLVTIDPVTARIDSTPPPVFIEAVIADRKAAAWSGPWNRDAAPRTLDIPPGRGELEFDYTALELQAPENSHFKYQLEGVDTDWMDAGRRRTAYYNNVYPGRYRFRVIACNKDGVWNDLGDSLWLTLRPHVWQTWWFRGLVAILVVGVASGSARYLTRKRLQRRLELLEQRAAIEKERGRIAKDIHDDLGSSLTRIMMLGERAEEGLGNREEVEVHVGKIVATARRTVQALDEIVWAVDPENDTLEGLVQYISHYADEFFENSNVNCRLEMPVELPALVLPAEVRHDLFLVVKEAFNNALKHARASEMRVQVSTDSPPAPLNQTSVTIQLQDDGCGFDLTGNGSDRKGNGLMNMRKRIEGLGGQLQVLTAPGQGTRLTITLTLGVATG